LIGSRAQGPQFTADPTNRYYNFGWQNFFGDVNRKGGEEPGDFPPSSYRPLATERVDEWITAEAAVIGELNCRPQWLAGYDRDRDIARILPSDDPYAGHSWRRNAGPEDGALPLDSPHIPGTGFGGWSTRDNEHAWFYHVEEWYYLTGNPWIRDWYEWIKEFRKSERSLPGLENWNHLSRSGWGATRDEAHTIANALQAFRITGDLRVLAAIRTRMDNVEAHRDARTGTFMGNRNEQQHVSIFEHGYFAHTMIQLMDEVGDDDPLLRDRAFLVLWGIVDFNYHRGNFTYFYDRSKPEVPAQSAGSGMVLADPQAWFGLTTGWTRYVDQVNTYIEGGLNGGSPPYAGQLFDLRHWTGASAYLGRITQIARRRLPPATPPDAVRDLAAVLVDGEAELRWTAPERASRLLGVWSTLPISATFTEREDERNPWGCRPLERLPQAEPGELQTARFRPPADAKRVWVALFSRSATGAMSEISNVVELEIP